MSKTYKTLIAISLFCMTISAFAAGVNLGTMGTTVSGQGSGIGGALKIVFLLLGFGSAGYGIYLFVHQGIGNKPTKGESLIWFFVGALLVALPFMIGSAQMTVTGADNTSNLGLIGVQ